MKTPDFWYKPPGFLSSILTPLSWGYNAGVAINRIRTQPARSLRTTICVGNIVAGGAGKTPLVLLLAETLTSYQMKPVIVSRGYGGRLKGPLKVNPALHTAEDVGDEALLMALSYPVYIGKDRVKTVKAAEVDGTHILLDDGLQNPSLYPHCSLLVVDGESGFGNERLLPSGPLRESPESVMKRVDAVIMIGDDEHHLGIRFHQPVFHAHLVPKIPADFPLNDPYLAFSGIARPQKFFKSCRELGLTLVDTISFPDHHLFTNRQLLSLESKAERMGAKLLTTAKDWIRLNEFWRKRVYVLPVILVMDELQTLKQLLRA